MVKGKHKVKKEKKSKWLRQGKKVHWSLWAVLRRTTVVDYRGIRQGSNDTREGICMGSCLENLVVKGTGALSHSSGE